MDTVEADAAAIIRHTASVISPEPELREALRGMTAEEAMMTEAAMGRYSLTKPAVMVFPNLFVPRAFRVGGKDKGEAKYSANFLFAPDHPDLQPMKGIAAQVARAAWPGRDLKTLKFPFSIGDKLADKTQERKGKDLNVFYRGNIVVAARSQFAPRLSGFMNGRVTDYDDDLRNQKKSEFYSGALVLVTFNFVNYNGVDQNPDGVTAYLDMVFSTNKGARVGGGMSAADAFKDFVGRETPEDPTGGAAMDDEIPF